MDNAHVYNVIVVCEDEYGFEATVDVHDLGMLITRKGMTECDAIRFAVAQTLHVLADRIDPRRSDAWTPPMSITFKRTD